MHRAISSSLLFALAFICIGQPDAIARPYRGYVLVFELTPDEGGNVVGCKLRKATHYTAEEISGATDFAFPDALLQEACASFRHRKVEVQYDRRNVIQPTDAPWFCLVRDDAPGEIDCHPSGRERVPVD